MTTVHGGFWTTTGLYAFNTLFHSLYHLDRQSQLRQQGDAFGMCRIKHLLSAHGLVLLTPGPDL